MSRFVDGKEQHTLVDVRSADKYRSGYIPGAVNISVQELSGKLNKIAKGRWSSTAAAATAAHMLPRPCWRPATRRSTTSAASLNGRGRAAPLRISRLERIY